MTHDETEHDGDDSEDARTLSGRIDDGDVSTLEAELQRKREPYARATVVRREPPASANVGDRAIVTADGGLHGWIGGAACAQSIVTKEGTEAIERGSPALIGIAPDPDTVDRPGLEAYPMSCHSEGVLELFVEPVAPTTELVIVGDSPVAQTLARLGSELAVDITLVAGNGSETVDVPEETTVLTTVDPETIAESIGREPLVVVASMGKYDARGIAAGVLADAPYIGLIASDNRAAEDIERAAGLIDRDPKTVAAAVTNPAGVDISAYTPAELAASLLAEVVDVRSRVSPASGAESAETGDEDSAHDGQSGTDSTENPEAGDGSTDDALEEAIDPVCEMTVDPAEAAATVDHDGETYYFCCHGCADSFENDPGAYLESEPEASP